MKGFVSSLVVLAVLSWTSVMASPLGHDSFEFVPNSPATVITVAEGTAATRDEAILKSLVSAANQAVGVLIISNQKVRNDRLISDDLFQQTAGIVNKYEVNFCSYNFSKYTCQIKALVSTKPLIEVMKSNGGQSVDVDGESEYAKQLMYRNNLQVSSNMLSKALAEVNSTGLSVTLLTTSIIQAPGPSTKVRVKANLGVDPAYYTYLSGITKRASEVKGIGSKVVLEIPGKEGGKNTYGVTNDSFHVPGSPVLLGVHFLGEDELGLAEECVAAKSFYSLGILLGQGFLVKFDSDREIEFSVEVPDGVLRKTREVKIGIGCSGPAERRRKPI